MFAYKKVLQFLPLDKNSKIPFFFLRKIDLLKEYTLFDTIRRAVWHLKGGRCFFCCWAFINYCVLSDNCVFTVLFTPIILTVYEYMGSFCVNNINRKKMIFLPILRKAFQSAGDVPCLHSVSLRWEQPINSQFMTCNVKNSLYFLFFSFLFTFLLPFFML